MIVLSQQLITAAWIHHGFDLNITKNSMYLVSYKLYVHRCKDKEDNREQDSDIGECLEANLSQLEKSQYITTRYGQLTWSGPIGIPDIGIVLMFICPRWPLLPFMCIILYVAGLAWWLNCCCEKELKHKGKNKITSQEVYSLLCCLPCTSCQHVKELRYQQKPKIISTFICFCILSS